MEITNGNVTLPVELGQRIIGSDRLSTACIRSATDGYEMKGEQDLSVFEKGERGEIFEEETFCRKGAFELWKVHVERKGPQ